MSDLRSVYHQMWANSIAHYENNTCDTDLLINDKTDMRRGVTVLSYLSDPVRLEISNFLSELKAIEPKQYYYPKNELHLTILSIISCATGFKLPNINVEAYSSVFKESIKSIGKFRIEYKGITVSPSCILIQGFPDSEQLNHLRNSLRVNFSKAKLESTMDARYELTTAHTTAVRCLTPFQNSSALMNVLSKYRDHDFGILEVDCLNLVFNNWYQNLAITKVLSSSKI